MKKFLLLLIFILGKTYGQENPVTWEFKSKKISACEYELTFKAKIAEGWHLYSLVPTSGDGAPNPTEFAFAKSRDYSLVGKVIESVTKTDFDKDLELTTIFHEGSASFTQRVKLKSSSTVQISGKLSYQTCNKGQCIFPPPKKFEFTLVGSKECDTSDKLNSDSLAAGIKNNLQLDSNTIGNGSALTAEKSLADASSSPKEDGGQCSPFETFIQGLLAGLLAVLMPCIYSLIPLTVSFFLKRSTTKTKGIKNSLLYGFFITFSFVALTMAITIIFGPRALSNIATNTGLNIFFFLLFIVFALSFFGLFEITLPSSWANKLDSKADKGGVAGIFFMALTLVVVSFSCTVGFMGGLLTLLARGGSYICPLTGFTGFGLGIALPFMLFAFFPSWLKALPKSGGWMNTFKVTIAFLELALAVKFLANADNVNEWGFITREVFIALWIGIFAMLTFYLLGVFRTSHDDPPSHLSVGRILWATIFLSFTIYMIPGLWGAPLKIIASFPPPHYYSESPNGVGGNHSSGVSETKGTDEISVLEGKRVVGPDGLMLFKDDYESALKYAKLMNKPLFIDFTGKACVNCRLMESNVWSKEEVLKRLKNDVVIVSLYVDSKVALPKEEQIEVELFGDRQVLETYGMKWGHMQISKYGPSAQPLYVIIDHHEKPLTEPRPYNENVQEYVSWLDKGLAKFKATNP